MNIALVREVESPESDFIEEHVSRCGDLTVAVSGLLGPTLGTVYDVAIGVGPVVALPVGRKRVLFALGPIAEHSDCDWDVIVVSSRAALRSAREKFGYRAKIVVSEPWLAGSTLGRHRVGFDRKVRFLHASSLGSGSRVQDIFRFSNDVLAMGLWSSYADVGGKVVPFDLLDFNCLVRNGAIGVYMSRTDGHDIQVRRHLALGGCVVCSRDVEVLGDLTDLCFDLDAVSWDSVATHQEPVECLGSRDDYAGLIAEVVGG